MYLFISGHQREVLCLQDLQEFKESLKRKRLEVIIDSILLGQELQPM